MKKIILFLIPIITIFGCSKDDGGAPSAETGSLKVKTTSLGDVPFIATRIYTEPVSQEKLTDDEGVALFEDLPIGTYEVFADGGGEFEIKKMSVNVVANQTKEVSFLFEPVVIEPEPLTVDAILNNLYNQLKNSEVFNARGYSLYWGDIGADVAYNNSSSSGFDLDIYNISPNTPMIRNVWEAHYNIVKGANSGLEFLEGLNPVTNPDVDKNKIGAAFRFFRALAYFNLVKLYGNPLLVTSTGIIDPVTIIQDSNKVYALIIEDLTYAENNLEASAPSNRASVPVAQALLGKVYLQMAGFPLLQNDKYALALAQFKKVEGTYSLEANYSDVFSIENESNNTEVIFKIDFESDGNYGVFWGPTGIALEDNLLLAPGFAESYFEDPNSVSSPVTFPLVVKDKRFDQNIATFSVVNDQVTNATDIDDWRPYKYKKDPTTAVTAGKESFDYIYLRYADILLMLAEAENAINGPTQIAYDAINKVRRRAFGNTNNDITPGLSQQEFFDVILQERRLELCYEGHRKDDLVRTQQLETVINAFNTSNPQNMKSYQSHEYIWPIPSIEINVNPNVVQNPGY